MNAYIHVMFRGYDVSYNFDDGKKLQVYYTKNDYVLVPLDKYLTEEDEIRALKRLKTKIIGVCSLCKWITEEKVDSKLQKSLRACFKFGFDFEIRMFRGILYFDYMDEFEQYDTHNINEEPLPPVIEAMAGYAEQKGALKVAEKRLPALFLNLLGSLSSHYAGRMEVSGFRHIRKLFNKTYDEYAELMDNLSSVGLKVEKTGFMCWLMDNAEKFISADSYQMRFARGGLSFYLVDDTGNERDVFFLGKEMEYVFDNSLFERMYQSCFFLNRIYYDLYETMRREGLSRNNVGIFMDNDRFYVTDFSDILRMTDYDKTYQFVLRTKDKILNSMQIKDEKALKMYAVLCSNNVNIMYKAMKAYGSVTRDGFQSLMGLARQMNGEIRENYSTVYSLLPRMKETGVLKDYFFNGVDDFTLIFTDYAKSIMEMDCVEMRPLVGSVVETIDFKEALECLPLEDVEKLMSNQEIVKKNTLSIINAMDSRYYCERYEDIFRKVLPVLDVKYLPLLKLKVRKIDAQAVMGNLYPCVCNIAMKGAV